MPISAGDILMKLGLDSRDFDSAFSGVGNAIEKHRKAIGIGMTAVGASITGVLGLAVKSAAEEEAGIQKLRVALQNVGVSYDEVKGSLEGVISATQTKTAMADDKQREALAELVAITGDYDKALALLPLTLDLATGKGMDMASSAQIIGRVAEGNTTILTRYGIQLKEGATATEALGELQAKYGGQAAAYGETMSGQMANLKNSMGDLMESIGAQLIPILSDLLGNYVLPFIRATISWAEAHPGLTKVIVILAAAIGGLLMVLGPIVIMLPGIIAALPLLGAAFALLTGPIGLVVLAIVGLVAAGVLLWKNWDTIKEKAIEIWGAIVEGAKVFVDKLAGFFLTLLEVVTFPYRKMINLIADGLNLLIGQLNKIKFTFPDWIPGLGGKGFALNIPEIALPKFAHGGMIPEPTLLYGLRSMRPYALAGEKGPEAVGPMGGYRTANIIVQLDGRVLAQALGQPLVDEIRLRQGLRI